MAIRNVLLILLLLLPHQSIGSDVKEATAGTDILPDGEREYRDKTQKMGALEIKVADAESQFSALVVAKNKAKTKAEALQFIEEMKVIRAQRDEDVIKFNALRDELQFKYPDMGRAIQQRYAPMQKKSVEQLERTSTLDADLTSAKKAAQRVYRPFTQEAEEKERAAAEATVTRPKTPAAPAEKASAPPKIRLEK